MDDELDLTAEVEAPWTDFRRWLADRIDLVELFARPFSPRQLRTVLRRFLDGIDGIAEALALALRVGGRRFLEEPEAAHPQPVLATSTHPGMVALLELLHLGPVVAPAVAALFEHDRKIITTHLITTHLIGIRLGVVDPGDDDEDDVLTCLRRGLLDGVTGEIPERRRRVPPRPRSEQASLITDGDLGEDTLDLGQSA